MPRFTPTLGVIGFDFGSKPAISVVLRRKRRPFPIDEDVPAIDCTVSLLCDSVANSASKCGFSGIGFTHFIPDPDNCSLCRSLGSVDDILIGEAGTEVADNRYFLSRVQTYTGCTNPGDSCPQCPTTGNSSGTITWTQSYDPSTCVLTGGFEGTITESHCVGDGCDSFYPPCTGEGCTQVDTEFTDNSGTACVTSETTYSDEFTDEMLLAAAIAGFGEYPDTFMGSCFALLDYNEDHSNVTVEKFKYKFSLIGTGTTDSYIKIYWTERLIPELTPGVPDPDPTHWINTDKTWTHMAGDGPVSESSVFEIDVPTTEGMTTVVNVAVSLDMAYDPPVIGKDSDCNDLCDPASTDCGQFGSNQYVQCFAPTECIPP